MKRELNSQEQNRQPGLIRLLLFSASMRTDSLNTRLAKLARDIIAENGGQVDFADMRDFDCPSYNQDDEKKVGLPHGAEHFRKRLLENDGFIVASPEYNAS